MEISKSSDEGKLSKAKRHKLKLRRRYTATTMNNNSIPRKPRADLVTGRFPNGRPKRLGSIKSSRMTVFDNKLDFKQQSINNFNRSFEDVIKELVDNMVTEICHEEDTKYSKDDDEEEESKMNEECSAEEEEKVRFLGSSSHLLKSAVAVPDLENDDEIEELIEGDDVISVKGHLRTYVGTVESIKNKMVKVLFQIEDGKFKSYDVYCDTLKKT